MKLVEMKCKNCGANLKVNVEVKDAYCQFCGTEFKIDDEVQHVQYDNMEQSGYEFEKGRIRAQQENNSNNDNKQVVYIKENNAGSKKHGCLFYFLCLMFFPFAISYFVIKSKNLSPGVKAVILIVMWAFFIGMSEMNQQEMEELSKKPWAIECTSISEFDYYIDGDNVGIKEYNGTDKRVKLCSNYNIDGKDYVVNKLSGSGFSMKSVYSVILPDTLVSMNFNSLSSSSLKYVYIPASLQKDGSYSSFYSYMHDMETIYYGGTEEQWKDLTNNVDRSKIDVKNIIYNAKIDDLK